MLLIFSSLFLSLSFSLFQLSFLLLHAFPARSEQYSVWHYTQIRRRCLIKIHITTYGYAFLQVSLDQPTIQPDGSTIYGCYIYFIFGLHHSPLTSVVGDAVSPPTGSGRSSGGGLGVGKAQLAGICSQTILSKFSTKSPLKLKFSPCSFVARKGLHIQSCCHLLDL